MDPRLATEGPAGEKVIWVAPRNPDATAPAGVSGDEFRRALAKMLFEHFLGGFVDLLHDGIVDAGVDAGRIAHRCAWDIVFCAVFAAGTEGLLMDSLARPVSTVDFSVVDASHDCEFSAVILDDLRNVVGGHAALPDIHAHVDHERHKVLAVGVGVVDDALDAV